MTPAKKCANAACSCLAATGSKYCSPHCEGMAKKTEIMCGCSHSNCSGSMHA